MFMYKVCICIQGAQSAFVVTCGLCHMTAYGKIRVSPRIERARVICQRPRKNFGKERAFGARARHG